MTGRRVGVTGHQGLPVQTRQLVAAALHDALAGCGPELVGVTMLGQGADQLFADAVLARGGRLEVVVAAERYRDAFDDPEAQRRYDELIAKAHHIERLPNVESTEAAHMAGGQVVVDRSDLMLAVWDGKPARGLGGTADVVAYARQRGVPVEVIWPKGATR